LENARIAKIASLLVVVCFLLNPGSASAGGHEDKYAAPARHVIPMESVDVLPGAVDPMYVGCYYTVPIQAVYQCPAAISPQLGSQVMYLRVNMKAGLLGGQPWLYHR
jgi:hypothetical protein